MTLKTIAVIGPTASGKTSFAALLAHRIGGEILSADSRQVYRGMDLGTGKDLEDYVVDGEQVPYHLIDICEPGTQYNLFEFQHDFFKAYDKVRANGHIPVICGGSGLYVESVLKGFKLLDVPQNPELRRSLQGKSLSELETILRGFKTLHNKTEVDSAQRAIRAIEIETYYRDEAPNVTEFEPLDAIIIGLDIDRETRRERISSRLRKRLDGGMVEEVRNLLGRGIPAENLIYYGLEYKFLTQYVIGELTYDEMVTSLEIAIHQFAKRQMTWFRGMERRGFNIHWIDAMLPDAEKVEICTRIMSECDR